MEISIPNIKEISILSAKLSKYTLRTPIIRCPSLEAKLNFEAEIFAKLEFLQQTGSFKIRAALAALRSLSSSKLQNGVVAVSAGNHAIATAYAAKVFGTSAKVIMTRSANPSRIASCKSHGAKVIIADDIHNAFKIAENLRKREGRFFVHPFEGSSVALGAGTIGLEICEQIKDFDSLIVPVGGGGLIGGLSNAIKQINRDVEIIGVEPTGADSMHRSFKSGFAERLNGPMNTIADSLGAPYAMPYSFNLTKKNVNRLILVSDLQLKKAMSLLFHNMKIAVEPACAASTAALFGPLRKAMQGKRVVLFMCGSNIDWPSFYQNAIFKNVS